MGEKWPRQNIVEQSSEPSGLRTGLARILLARCARSFSYVCYSIDTLPTAANFALQYASDACLSGVRLYFPRGMTRSLPGYPSQELHQLPGVISTPGIRSQEPNPTRELFPSPEPTPQVIFALEIRSQESISTRPRDRFLGSRLVPRSQFPPGSSSWEDRPQKPSTRNLLSGKKVRPKCLCS
jgi:hypothetical protein